MAVFIAVKRRRIWLRVLAQSLGALTVVLLAEPAIANSGLQRLSQALNSGELTAQELDAIWASRHRLHGSLQAYARSEPVIPDDFEVLIRLARLTAYTGHFVFDSGEISRREEAFTLGFQVSERAIELGPEIVDGYYWHAINFLGYLDTVGPISLMRRADLALENLNRAVQLDPQYLNASPLRARALLYLKLPPQPFSSGSLDLAGRDIAGALSLAGGSSLNRLAALRIALEAGSSSGAREQLRLLKEAILNSEGAVEDAAIRNAMRKLEREMN